MSIQAMVGVMSESATSGNTRLVLLCIANYEGEHGAWPSVDRLAKDANCSVRSVQNAIGTAEKAGELKVERRSGPNGTNVYHTKWGEFAFLIPGARSVGNDILSLAKRDGWNCSYCGCVLDASSATRDHVIPRRQGGHDGLSNLVLACVACNSKKGPRTPEQWRADTPQNLHPAEHEPGSAPELKELGSTVSTYNSSSTELKSCAPSSRDELFEALYLVQTGEKYTAETRISPRERGKINKARAELKAAGYSGADILAAIPGWTIAMGDLNITALGLSGNMRRCLNAAAGAVFRQEVQRETVEDRALKLVREHMAEEERRAIEIGEVLT